MPVECDADVGIDISDSKNSKEILIESNIKSEPYGDEGCRFHGEAQVAKVAGEISLTHTGSPDLFNLMDFLVFNSSHVFEDLHFGPMIPNMVNPLMNVHKTIKANGTSSIEGRTDRHCIESFVELRSCCVQILCQNRSDKVHLSIRKLCDDVSVLCHGAYTNGTDRSRRCMSSVGLTVQ